MNLEHIKLQVCAVCGTYPVQESKNRQQCNGEWNEKRVFSCGSVVAYSSNFREERIISPCPLDPIIIDRLRKRAAAKSKVVKCINGLDVDTDYKRTLDTAVKYM